MDRRQFLIAGASATIALAGCIEAQEGEREEGSTDAGGANGVESGSGNGEESGSEDPVEILEHEWYHEGAYDAGVSGRAENVSGEELSYVEISVFFLDEEDVQIGESLDNTSDLAAGRVWAFDAKFFDGDADQVADYEIKWEVVNA